MNKNKEIVLGDSHNFKACSAGIIASCWRHSTGVISDISGPCLANSQGTLTHGDAASTSGEDGLATTIPPKAVKGVQSILYTSKDTDWIPAKTTNNTVRYRVVLLQREVAGYLMMTLGSCVALQFRVAVVPLMTRWSTGGTEMTVRPVKYST